MQPFWRRPKFGGAVSDDGEELRPRRARYGVILLTADLIGAISLSETGAGIEPACETFPETLHSHSATRSKITPSCAQGGVISLRAV